MTINFGKYYGIQLRRMRDGDGRMYLTAVIWFRRSHDRLGYWYPTIRWF